MNHETANKIYNILVHTCGAGEDERQDFIRNHTDEQPVTEWRFRGWLGMGGKFRSKTLTVDCYQEDATKERKGIIKRANEELRAMAEKGEVTR